MIISCNIHVTFSRLQAGVITTSFKHHNYALSYHHCGVMSRSCDALISSDLGILTMVKSYYYVFSEYTCILTSYCSFICNKCSSSVNQKTVSYYYCYIIVCILMPNGSNMSPYRIKYNTNRSPYRIKYNTNTNRSPYRIQYIIPRQQVVVNNLRASRLSAYIGASRISISIVLVTPADENLWGIVWGDY